MSWEFQRVVKPADSDASGNRRFKIHGSAALRRLCVLQGNDLRRDNKPSTNGNWWGPKNRPNNKKMW